MNDRRIEIGGERSEAKQNSKTPPQKQDRIILLYMKITPYNKQSILTIPLDLGEDGLPMFPFTRYIVPNHESYFSLRKSIHPKFQLMHSKQEIRTFVIL